MRAESSCALLCWPVVGRCSRRTRQPDRGFLGISFDASQTPQTTVIDRVIWGGAGRKAGLMHGDTIVAINEQNMATPKDILTAIGSLSAGDTVSVTINRGGTQRDFKITLGANPPTVGPLGGDWKEGDAAGVTQDHAVETFTLPDSVAKTTLRSVSFIDAADGWIVGGKGVCLRTTDGGKNWTTLAMAAGTNFRTVQFSADGTGWITGDGEPNSPAARACRVLAADVFRHAVSHNRRRGELERGLGADEFSTLRHRRLAGRSRPRHLRRRRAPRWIGDHFRNQPGRQSHPTHVSIAVCHGDAEQGPGDRGGNSGAGWIRRLAQIPTILSQANCRAIFSNDGGTTWDASKGSDGNDYLRGLATSGEKLAIAVGDNGTILRSEDAGDSWTAITGAPNNRSTALRPTAKDFRSGGKPGNRHRQP